MSITRNKFLGLDDFYFPIQNNMLEQILVLILKMILVSRGIILKMEERMSNGLYNSDPD